MLIFALIAACVLDVDTGNAFHMAVLPDTAVALTIGNSSPSNETYRGRLTVRDFFGRGFDIPVDVQVPIGGTVRLPIPAEDCRRKGIYRVSGTLTDSAGCSTNVTTRYAIIAPHPVTPVDRSGRFLPGINFHVDWWTPEARTVCYDILNAIGAKLVRCGGMTNFARTCANGPEPDFTETDEVYGELKRRGLAVNANLHGAPQWALQPEKKGLKRSVNQRSKPIDGALRTYAEKVAKRFGTDIAYYEVGNELDLVSPETMTIDEAIAAQKEAYVGVKAGCPDAQVITCGFAFPDSDMKQVLQKGMQERLVADAKDFYDLHAVHLHGGFDRYVEFMRRFFAMRERQGVADKPWYANECAVTSTGGREDEAAATVWRKMLYAWSHGSPGYIWYNLRAKGMDPKNHENGYGIVTWDFHPRAAAASFAGFTDVFTGAERDAVLIEQERRFAYRFRRDHDILLAGWDMNLSTTAVVRVKTDARRAFVSDLMGNRTELVVKNGTIEVGFDFLPQAWTFENATFAEPMMDELGAVAHEVDAYVVTVDHPVEFVLNRATDMHEIYAANPIYEHRCWRGPDDLSARIVLSRERTGKVRVSAFVRDEREAQGDTVMCVWAVDGFRRAMPLSRVSRDGGETVYEASFAPDITARHFRVVVHDDDGEGEDGWAEIGPITVFARQPVDVKIDWDAEIGQVKPVNAVGQPPMLGGPMDFKMMHYLKDAGVPYSRLHDVGGWQGQGLWVDIPNLFPDFSANENDRKNYRFDMTDALLGALIRNGIEPYFRLGVTIENFAGCGYSPRRTVPPKNFAKWARICEHVIRHYNEGWADGFKMNITYWEIWNEPDNYPEIKKNCMWKGGFDSYVQFYGKVAPYLKSKFPRLKIGGYGSCGFYAGAGADHVSGANSSPRTEHFVTCAHRFLKAVKVNGWPLDFFSFHSYSEPVEAMRQVRFADELLNLYGFTRDRTERHFNEWLPYVSHDNLGTAKQSAGIAAELIGLQNGPVDIACIYDARCGIGNYSPLFDPMTYKPHRAYYAFTAFNELRKRGKSVAGVSSDPNVWVAAAKGALDAVVMIANDSDEVKPLKLDVGGRAVKGCRLTDANHADASVFGIPHSLPPHSFVVLFF